MSPLTDPSSEFEGERSGELSPIGSSRSIDFIRGVEGATFVI